MELVVNIDEDADVRFVLLVVVALKVLGFEVVVVEELPVPRVVVESLLGEVLNDDSEVAEEIPEVLELDSGVEEVLMLVVEDTELDEDADSESVVKLVGSDEVGVMVLSGMTTEVPFPGRLSVVITLVVVLEVVRLLSVPPFANPSEVMMVLVLGISIATGRVPLVPSIT